MDKPAGAIETAILATYIHSSMSGQVGAFQTALREAGYIILPEGPTRKMVKAGWDSGRPHSDFRFGEFIPQDIYEAMIAAAKERDDG